MGTWSIHKAYSSLCNACNRRCSRYKVLSNGSDKAKKIQIKSAKTKPRAASPVSWHYAYADADLKTAF